MELSRQRKSLMAPLPLSEVLCCKICFGIYKSPKLMPCLHSFCVQCLSEYFHDDRGNHSFSCPICSCTVDLKTGCVDELWDNILLERAILHSVAQVPVSSESQHEHEVTVNDIINNKSHFSMNELKFSDAVHDPSDSAMVQSISCNAMMTENSKTHFFQKSDSLSSIQNRCLEHKNTSLSLNAMCISEINYKKNFPESSSEMSNFSISSLKFNPPSDYDIVDFSDCGVHRTNKIDENPMSNFSTYYEQCEHIQDSISTLQSAALNTIYDIDEKNNDVKQWQIMIEETKEKIQQRSKDLQTYIKQKERQILSDLDDIIIDQNILQRTENQKDILHSRLKRILSIINFSRMTLDFATEEEFGYLINVLEKNKTNLNLHQSEKITCELSFHVPDKQGIDNIISKLFGTLQQSQHNMKADGSKKNTKQNTKENLMDQKHIFCKNGEKSMADKLLAQRTDVIAATYTTAKGEDSISKQEGTITTHAMKENQHKHEMTNNFISTLDFPLPLTPPKNGMKNIACSDDSIPKQNYTEQDNIKDIEEEHVTIKSKQNALDKYTSLLDKEEKKTVANKTISGIILPEKLKKRVIRRHTEESLKYEGNWSSSNRQESSSNHHRLLHLSDEIQKTKFMIDLCRSHITNAQNSPVSPLLQTEQGISQMSKRRFSVQETSRRFPAPTMSEALGFEKSDPHI